VTTSYATWVPSLAAHYQQILSTNDSPSAAQLQAHNTLQLASSSLNKVALNQQLPEHTLQIAVMGPTQSGKSTLVNALLGRQVAKASALAGFTVHAQGYAIGSPPEDQQGIDELMQPLIRTAANQLDAAQLDHYALESVESGAQALVQQAIVWDTPDFDSIESNTYKQAVLKTIALADVIILIVSKDKYGDKSVWDMLSLLHDLQKQTVIMINKLDEQDQQIVSEAFDARYQQQFNKLPQRLLLPFVAQQASAQHNNLLALPEQSLQQLNDTIASLDVYQSRTESANTIDTFIQQHQQLWLAPLYRELQAQAIWEAKISDIIKQADNEYASDYLSNPDKYDTFNRALAELLTLLEIPGVANTLGRARRLVTWPARRLLGVGRAVVSRNSGTGNSQTADEEDPETLVLSCILDSTLIHLQSELLEAPDEPWWQALTLQFREQEDHIRQQFDARSIEVRAQFEPQIEAAAAKLYEQLQTQPTLLNTLRAARASADAAGIALAVKSGGLAPADLILAPAMLSVTSLLTESALGRYLDATKRELLQAQRLHVHNLLFTNELGEHLMQLSVQLKDDGLYTKNMDSSLKQHVLSLFES